MFIFRDRPVSIMVIYAISLHYVWSVILLTDSAALRVTAVDALHRFIPMPWLPMVLAAVASLALIAMAAQPPWFVVLLLPQQILLVMSAAGAVEAIWIAQYADGAIRDRAFIAADQFYSILACIGHTVAITAHASRLGRQ
jgi:hypothetical protein